MIFQKFLFDVKDWRDFHKWKNQSRIAPEVIDSAAVEFITHMMLNRGFKAKRQCVKDVDILFYIEYLHELFPKAKFIYMIRDGRAAAYSLTVNKYVAYEQDQDKVGFTYLLIK